MQQELVANAAMEAGIAAEAPPNTKMRFRSPGIAVSEAGLRALSNKAAL